MSTEYIFYGAKLGADQITSLLEHIFSTNLRLESSAGERGTPICIWGTHGIGKTMLVRDFARKRGWKLAYCAPAQFEEMGDLHGLPTRVDPDPNIIGDEYTAFLPPEWVPTDEGPGILLLDDLNRSDDRILRGLMQLLQNFEMFSWSLPPKWQIVATANPEGGDYSITPMDDAMLTRMMHLTMLFDVRSWAHWAMRSGIDPRGIDFVLTYPETVTGARTTPRSLSQFFHTIKDIRDLKAELDLVTTLAMSALDEVTVTTFINFVNDNLQKLIDPMEILDAADFAPIHKRIQDLAGGKADAKRVDRLATICTRVYLTLIQPDFVPGPRTQENLVAFMLHPAIPNDLRFSLHKDLANAPEKVRSLIRDPRLARLVLAGM